MAESIYPEYCHSTENNHRKTIAGICLEVKDGRSAWPGADSGQSRLLELPWQLL